MGHDQNDQTDQHDQSDQTDQHDRDAARSGSGEDQPMTRATEHYDDDKVRRPSGGHTWGAAVTSLIGPTDATVGAVDADEPRVLQHQAVERQIEEAIVSVAKTHGGTHSREVVKDALQRELERRGRWPQPEPWLDAVASELEAGGLYNMGTDPTDLERRESDPPEPDPS